MKALIIKYPNLASLILSALIASLVFLILLFSLFEILIIYFPAETVLEDGTIVKNQAMAQFFMSLVVGGTISFILFIILFFKTGRKFEGWSNEHTN